VVGFILTTPLFHDGLCGVLASGLVLASLFFFYFSLITSISACGTSKIQISFLICFSFRLILVLLIIFLLEVVYRFGIFL
jgi:hypothetical protein